jgi:IPT/TIG domain
MDARVIDMCRTPSRKSTVFVLVLALLVGCLAPLAFERPARAAEGEFDWVDAGGPGNGDAMALVSDNVHGILYRATVGSAGNTEFGKGVWKYQAGTWTSLGGEVASLGITTLAYDSAGDRLYAGSNGQGIWCYDPSDGTWTETNYFLRAFDVTALAFGGGKLYAGLWDRAAAFGTNGKGVWYYDPTDPSGVYTDTGGGVAAFRILSLAWGGDRLYAGPSDRSSGETYKGVWYYNPASPDTDKWTDTGGGMTNRRADALAYDGTNNILYSGAGLNGSVWYYDPALSDTDKWTYTFGGAMLWHEVTCLAFGEGKLYAGCVSTMGEGDKGVWCYDRPSNTWSDTGGGLSAFQMKSLAFDTYHHHLFAGTTQDGVWRYNLADSPPTWSDTRGGVSTSYVNCLAYDSTSRLLYAGTDSDGVWCYNPATGAWTDISGGVGSFETICLAFGGGKLYAGCFDHLAPAYMGVWCYDPASPDADKWTDTGGTAKAINNLVFDEGSNMLYAGTGEKYTDAGGQGVWRYDPDADTDKWSDISGGDIDAYKIDSLTLGGGMLYAGICDEALNSHLGAWWYDLTNPSAGWTNTGGSVSTFEISSLAWGGGKLYAGCWDWTQYPDVGEGVWCYDPTIPAPDKWASTGGSMSNNITYSLAWDGENEKLYTSCVYWFTAKFDGVWGYDPASPDTDKWWDTGGGVGSYYVSSLVYDDCFHRLYTGTGGEGVWYYAAPPAISSLGPASGGVGSEVTINGACFGPGGTGTEYVTFGGVPAVVKPGTWTDASVVCYVPAGVSGTVPVIAYNLNGSSNQVDFTVLPPPAVTSLAPKAGVVGSVVTVTGTGFGATRGTSYVSFGQVKATNYVSWSDTEIHVKVTPGLYGLRNLSVTTGGGKSNLKPFKVIPRITKISPKSGPVGTQVTITGTGFGPKRGTSTVKFGITAVTKYVSWSNTQIVVKVPVTGTGTKDVKVTTSGGRSEGMPFTVQ